MSFSLVSLFIISVYPFCIVFQQAENQAVGASYASALVDLAQQKNALEAIHSDMDTLSSMMRDNSTMVSFMTNPLVSAEKKQVGQRSRHRHTF